MYSAHNLICLIRFLNVRGIFTAEHPKYILVLSGEIWNREQNIFITSGLTGITAIVIYAFNGY